MTDFTVIICTYNGERRLPQVLERLRSQVGTESFTWEILIVDNNSQDGTARLVGEYRNRWTTERAIRYTFEPEQGLAYARRRAMALVQSPWAGFLDDDNWPTETWVRAAWDFARQHPEAGAFGSRIQGQFEVDPPPNFQRIACFFAIVDRGERPRQYPSQRGVLPAGAGMVVNPEAWHRCVPAQPRLKGVCGSSLATKGEDVETLSYIRQAGYPIWYNPEMQLLHFIPKERLARDYLMTFFRGVGLGRYSLRMVRYRPWQRPAIALAYAVDDFRRLVEYWLEHRVALRQNDLVSQCELMLHWAIAISPFHHWKNRMKYSTGWIRRRNLTIPQPQNSTG
ncbi:MAG: hormogonium polysaccharide biosynthesis glycosyltransferase HpsE [Cyanobacteriota bacterium]|nr:hormogonium polysaccharide biosynthesis glycosyltransferase HpsE [Cyanobacteriota bacterium]